MIFTPTWLNIAPFWVPKPTKIPSWRRLEASWARLGGLLGRLERVLERLGLILERLGPSQRRLGGLRPPTGVARSFFLVSSLVRKVTHLRWVTFGGILWE